VGPALPDRPSADPGELTLALVYRDHASFVARVVQQLGAERGAVEDLVHDVFLVVARRLQDFDPQRSLRGWLFGISRNIVHSHSRGARRRACRTQHAAPPSPSPATEDDLWRQRAAAHVDRFLAGLPPEMQLVFVMSEVEDMSAPEIAEALGLNCNTIYSRVRRTRRRFETFVAALAKESHDRP